MWTLQDAKNRFSTVVDAAMAGRPQEVTRRGKPAVVVLADSEYRRLLAASGARQGSFIDHLMAFPAGDVEFERIDVTPREVEF